MIEAGVDVDAIDKWGRSALFYSARAGTLPTMKLLVELGQCEVNQQDRFGNDAFWMAESRSMYECAMYLFAHDGANTAALVKSRGLGSQVVFDRPLLRGDVPTARKHPYAITTVRSSAEKDSARRIVLFGGFGVRTGQSQPNNLEPQDDQRVATENLFDLYCP